MLAGDFSEYDLEVKYTATHKLTTFCKKTTNTIVVDLECKL